MPRQAQIACSLVPSAPPVTAGQAGGPHTVHYTQLSVTAPGQGKADTTGDWQHSEASAASETP